MEKPSKLANALSWIRGMFLFGAMRDKAIAEIAEILFPLATHVIATGVHNPRSATPDEIRQAASRAVADVEPAESVRAALARALQLTPKHGLKVITGSIYLVGEVLSNLDVARAPAPAASQR